MPDSTMPGLPVSQNVLPSDIILICQDPFGLPSERMMTLSDLRAVLVLNAPAGVQSPGNGQYYMYEPHLAQNGVTVIGRWVAINQPFLNPDDGVYYALIPRTAPGGDVSSSWLPVAQVAQNPDNSLYYQWVPVLGQDGVTVSGKWVLTTTVNVGTPVPNPDDGHIYTWTPKLGQDGVTIVGTWVLIT